MLFFILLVNVNTTLYEEQEDILLKGIRIVFCLLIQILRHTFWPALCIAVCSPALSLAIELEIALSPEETAWLSKHPDVTITFDADFPPYSFINDSGELEGMAVDVVKQLEKKLNLDFKFAVQPNWTNLFQKAMDKEVDVVASMVINQERKQNFLFTEPYIFKPYVVVTSADNKNITTNSDLAGKRISLVKHYNSSKKLIKDMPSIKPVYVDSLYQALNHVSLGKADATVTFFGASHYYRSKYLMTDLKYVSLFTNATHDEGFAVRKDWPELHSILNKALKSISEQEMLAIRNNWLPSDYSESFSQIKLTAEEKQWIEQHKHIRLGVDPEFAPFEFIDKKQYQGMASEYVQILNKRLGLNMQVAEGLSWEEVINKTRQKQIDVLPAVGKNSDREQYLNFTEPYLNFHRVIVARDDLPFIAGINDIRGLKVAVQENSSHHGFINEQTNLQPELYPTLQSALMAVSGGDMDVMIGNVASSTYWIRKLNLTNLKVSAPVSNQIQHLHFAIRDDWPELKSILQKGLDSISDRKHGEISNKWLTLKYQPEKYKDLIWKVVLAFCVLLGLFFVWNMLLNRKVKQRTEQLNYTANYDRLTGLPNDVLVFDRLTQALNDAEIYDYKLAVLSIDLNGFKNINDLLGHSIGDQVLGEIAIRLNKDCMDVSTIGRLRGDHFVIVVNRFDSTDEIAQLSQTVLTSIKAPFLVEGNSLNLTANIGIALYPQDGLNANTLLKKADSAAHSNSSDKTQSIAFYTERISEQVARKFIVEKHLINALQHHEIEVYYQPKVESRSRNIVGFEALARWYNPELGWITPDEFIEIAEQSSLIEDLGWFVLETSLNQLAIWQNVYDSNLSMAVNLSPKQLYSTDFLTRLEQVIDKFDVKPEALEFEITEGVFVSDSVEVDSIFKRLKQLKISLAMDDFGKGYSSLSYLRKYAFSTLKIDREFISELESKESDKKLVSAAIAMSKGLGMKVIAEGVETEKQYLFLLSQGCDVQQGWAFSKALPNKELEAIMKTSMTM